MSLMAEHRSGRLGMFARGLVSHESWRIPRVFTRRVQGKHWWFALSQGITLIVSNWPEEVKMSAPIEKCIGTLFLRHVNSFSRRSGT